MVVAKPAITTLGMTAGKTKMNKLEELIKELCPDGVEYKTLETVCDITKGIQFNKENMFDEGTYPVINGGINPSGYIEQFNQDENTITISQGGASAGYVNWITTKFWAGAHCYVLKPKEDVLNRYLFHFVKSMENKLQECQYGAGIPALAKSTIATLEIPVPPLEVQKEIVRILDSFTELEKELEKELAARKKQYEWMKQKLLNIKKDNLFELQELCRLEKGKTPIQKAIPGEYPLVVTTDKRSTCKDYQFDCKAVCLSLVSARGHGIAQISRIFYQEGKFALGNILCAIIPKDEKKLNAKYLQYYLFYMKDVLLTPLMKGGANVALHVKDLETVKLPLPPLAEQERIVSILDRFDSLCNSLTSGLPAEIEARRRQYQYYRDKLLSFKRC